MEKKDSEKKIFINHLVPQAQPSRSDFDKKESDLELKFKIYIFNEINNTKIFIYEWIFLSMLCTGAILLIVYSYHANITIVNLIQMLVVNIFAIRLSYSESRYLRKIMNKYNPKSLKEGI